MDDLLQNLSFHAPLFKDGFSVQVALLIAIGTGIALAFYCRSVYGAFFVWGLVVGSVGFLLLWLLSSVLAVKWALIVVAALILPIVVLFYIDENSIVKGDELKKAAAQRNIDITELIGDDPEAADSIAETLNLGIEDRGEDWPEGSAFKGIPRNVVRNATMMMVAGYGVLALISYQLI